MLYSCISLISVLFYDIHCIVDECVYRYIEMYYALYLKIHKELYSLSILCVHYREV